MLEVFGIPIFQNIHKNIFLLLLAEHFLALQLLRAGCETCAEEAKGSIMSMHDVQCNIKYNIKISDILFQNTAQ